VEAIRALRAVRGGAIKARTAAINQLKGLLVTAPASLREALDALPTTALVAACAQRRPDEAALAEPVQGVKAALGAVAQRMQQLDQKISRADQRLATLVGRAAPRLLKLPAIGVDHAGQLLTTAGDNPERLRGEAAFAHLCGTAPIPASSGTTHRHRPHRGVTATPTGLSIWPWSFVCAGVHAPAAMPNGAPSRGSPNRRACAASSATSPGRSTTPWSRTSRPFTRLDDLYEHPGICGGSDS
jgi:Transposase IS116/IS110/IS902 family